MRELLKKLATIAFFIMLFVVIILIIHGKAKADDRLPGFYLKGDAGGYFLNKVKEDKIITQKAKISPFIGVGVGYHINDRLRADIMLDYADIQFKKDLNSVNRIIVTNIKKAKITGLMINGYIDLFKLDNIRFFGGLGVGKVRISETDRWLANLPSGPITGSLTKKTIVNWSYKATLGTEIGLNSNTVLDISYNLRDFGKTPRFKEPNLLPVGKKHLKVHNVELGIRVNI
jgi:opacity protein-like surface antigen